MLRVRASRTVSLVYLEDCALEVWSLAVEQQTSFRLGEGIGDTRMRTFEMEEVPYLAIICPFGPVNRLCSYMSINQFSVMDGCLPESVEVFSCHDVSDVAIESFSCDSWLDDTNNLSLRRKSQQMTLWSDLHGEKISQLR